MCRHERAEQLLAKQVAPGYVRPAYDGWSFANVPATVGELLGVSVSGTPLAEPCHPGGRSATVVVVVLDGFGFEQFARHYQEHSLFDRLATETDVWPLTSVFPSETATAMGTYTTGQPPIAHGRIGWNVPIDGTIVASLPFTTTDGTPVDEQFGVDRRAFIAGETVAAQLAGAGVRTTQVLPDPVVTVDPAHELIEQHRFSDLDGFADAFGRAIAETSAGFVHAYLPHIDGAAHGHGTSAIAYSDTLDSVASALEAAIRGLPSSVTERTRLLVTADHGHVDTDPASTIDLCADDEITSLLGRDQSGRLLVGGGGRNLHCYPAPEDRDRLVSAFDRQFDEDLLVLTRQAAIDAGLFGPGQPSAVFDRLCGDVLVIPRDGKIWHRGDPDELEFVGFHGGLHPDEQLVPFAALELDALT